VCELLGSGEQRTDVPMLVCLFYIGELLRTDLPYLSGRASKVSAAPRSGSDARCHCRSGRSRRPVIFGRSLRRLRQTGCHGLAPDGSLTSGGRGGHPARRSALLDHAGSAGPGGAPDKERIAQVHALYKRAAPGARDDAIVMRFLVRGCSYNPKRPSMIR
jgi:hypothetical protein